MDSVITRARLHYFPIYGSAFMFWHPHIIIRSQSFESLLYVYLPASESAQLCFHLRAITS
jgi:hypothetical protein